MVSVRFQSAPAGSGTWTDRCTDSAAPYTCDWATGALSDGFYDLRAIALDAGGYSRSSTVTNRRVDNAAPTVALTDPGTPLTGARTLSATASDTGGSNVASVAFEYRTSPSGSWTAICTDSGAPYSCGWDTAALPDGLYDLRATAVDGARNTTSSTVANRRLDNAAPSVSLTDDGTAKAGTVPVQATTGDGAGVASVRYEVRPAGGGAWTEACTAWAAPFSCDLDTTLAPDGLYELRAIATDGASFTTTSNSVTAQVDNTAPTWAAMTSPGTPLSGTVTLDGTGSDAVGLGAMRFEYRLNGTTGAWSTACTDTTPPSPFSCSWDTSAAADGSYDVRAVAVDSAGNTLASAAVTARIVDHNGPVVSVTGPAQVRGTANTVTTRPRPASRARRAHGPGRRKFEISVRRPKGVTFKKVTVTVNGRPKVKVDGLKARKLKATVNLRGLPKGKVVVKVVAQTTAGANLTSTRTYRTCTTGAKKVKKARKKKRG